MATFRPRMKTSKHGSSTHGRERERAQTLLVPAVQETTPLFEDKLSKFKEAYKTPLATLFEDRYDFKGDQVSELEKIVCRTLKTIGKSPDDNLEDSNMEMVFNDVEAFWIAERIKGWKPTGPAVRETVGKAKVRNESNDPLVGGGRLNATFEGPPGGSKRILKKNASAAQNKKK